VIATMEAQHLALEWPDADIDKGFETVSGLIHWRLGRLPRTTDRIRWQDWTFEVVDMDGQRIDKVRAVRVG
jgi:putative hemolysin